jgi:hypothetical protein
VAYVALFDACVLYSSRVRDLLLNLAVTDVFQARWTEVINDEWVGRLKENRPDLDVNKIDRTRQRVNDSVPDCLITGYESLIPSLTWMNPKDRHVTAAAIRGRVDVIVTFDLDDFPREPLSVYRIDVQHPDEFVLGLLGYSLDIFVFCEVIKQLRTGLKSPPVSPEEYLSNLAKAGLPKTSFVLQQLIINI